AVEGPGEGERSAEADRGRPGSGHQRPKGSRRGKLLSPARRRRAVAHVRKVVGVSERRACQVLGQARSSQRYRRVKPEGDAALVATMDQLRKRYKRAGYRGVWIRLRRQDWRVN